MNAKQFLDKFQEEALEVATALGPWLAPIPTAFLVGRAMVNTLHYPLPVGVVIAFALEFFGLAVGALALELRAWNATKRKTDPPASVRLAYALGIVYLVAAIGLTILLDIFPALARFAPGVFPLLSLAGVMVLAMRQEHARLRASVKADKEERKAERQNGRSQPVNLPVNQPVKQVSNTPKIDKLQAGKEAKKANQMETLLDIYKVNPLTGVTDAARQVGVTRQTIYNWLDELESTGRVHQNGNGVEVHS